jgi:ABC-2 type transport system ATP-binding protein
MEDVEALCERVIIINHGELGYDGSLSQLLATYIDCKVLEISFTERVLKGDLEKLGRVREFNPRRVVLEVEKSEAKKVAAKILTKFPVDDILINEEDISEVVRKIFSEKR